MIATINYIVNHEKFKGFNQADYDICIKYINNRRRITLEGYYEKDVKSISNIIAFSEGHDLEIYFFIFTDEVKSDKYAAINKVTIRSKESKLTYDGGVGNFGYLLLFKEVLARDTQKEYFYWRGFAHGCLKTIKRGRLATPVYRKEFPELHDDTNPIFKKNTNDFILKEEIYGKDENPDSYVSEYDTFPSASCGHYYITGFINAYIRNTGFLVGGYDKPLIFMGPYSPVEAKTLKELIDLVPIFDLPIPVKTSIFVDDGDTNKHMLIVERLVV